MMLPHLQSTGRKVVDILAILLFVGHTMGMSTGSKVLSTDSVSSIRNNKSAVIVGGGPTGLAASLMLEKCGWDDITIIEKRPISFFESGKAYLYLIDGRGQKCTDLLGILAN